MNRGLEQFGPMSTRPWPRSLAGVIAGGAIAVVTEQPNARCVYVDVDVQNVGNVKIEGKTVTVSLMPMNGDNDLLKTAIVKRIDDLDSHDPDRVYTIDKGEFSSFSFAFALPKGATVTACRIESRYSSTELTDIKTQKHLTWMRSTILPVAPAQKIATATGTAGAN